MFGKTKTKTKTEFAKIAASGVVQYSTSFTVGAIIHAVCPTSSPVQRAKMIVGSYAIGAMVADQAAVYTGRQIDMVIQTVTQTVTEIKAKQNAQPTFE